MLWLAHNGRASHGGGRVVFVRMPPPPRGQTAGLIAPVIAAGHLPPTDLSISTRVFLLVLLRGGVPSDRRAPTHVGIFICRRADMKWLLIANSREGDARTRRARHVALANL